MINQANQIHFNLAGLFTFPSPYSIFLLKVYFHFPVRDVQKYTEFRMSHLIMLFEVVADEVVLLANKQTTK